MIEASDIVDLTEGATLERSEDGLVGGGTHGHGGQSLILVTAGRRGLSGDSSGIVLQEIDEMTSKDELDANSVLDVDYKDVKSSFEELCPVCGDRVSGYHYGLLTCESCKGFFKRTVQNKKVYSCVDNRSCQIDKSQRKRCPYCRFQKCLNVGMKLEAVRSDRMRGGRNKFGPMYKRDRALKQQAARQVHPLQDSCIGELSLIANGMIEVGSPGSPEDVKPDPHILQASLHLYSDAVPNSTTSSIVSSLISGSNCLSSTAAAPSSIASISTSSSSHASCISPTPAHPHHHHLPHSNHHLLVPISPSDFTQNFSHISATSQHQSPKTYFPHHHKSQHHPHNGSTTIEQESLSPENSHHYTSNHISHANQTSEYHQPQSNNQITQQRHNSPLMSSVQDRESSYPNVIEALRTFKGSPLTCHSERSLLLPLINEIKATLLEESGVKQKMITFMQSELSQTDSANPEQFLPILCRMVDQLLFLMVEWARNSTFFKEIKVEDQMKLLHNSWSEILILDFIYRQVHNVWGKEIRMPNGEVVGLEILDKLGLGDVKAKVFELVKKGRELSLDFNEYMCLKFIILLSPDVSGLENRSYIEQSQEKITAALLEYCRQVYPNMGDKYSQLLMRLPEIRLISIRTEDFLYFKHLNNEVPDQTLLTEVLHAKRRG